MNRTAIKNFAIWARRSLREQVRARAIQFGISASEIQEAQPVSGGLVVAGQALNADEAAAYRLLRSHLQDLMQVHKQARAIEMLIDEIAYTWFNRLAALRFMEVNGYLTTRVLSSSDPRLVDPDLLRDAGYLAEAGEFPGLDLETLDEWRSLASRAPNPEEWLYRKLLVAQCEALAAGLPFLFDRTQNYTALFVPTNLLNQDAIVRRLVTDIPEDDWRDSSASENASENGVEIIGWLYQFYISERKDEVIGAKSKVAAQDIPAATQLFTPHWIVRYMVENSLGRLWLEAHPESGLRSRMPYYLDQDPHPPAPSPLVGEGEQDVEVELERWEVPEGLKQKMKEVAREFRKQPTASEALLWQALRGSKLAGRKFRRQQPIGTFVVDFFCAAERLIVEVDGTVHDRPEQQSLDLQRQTLLESLGLKFVRVSSQQVESDLATVLKTIEQSFIQPTSPPTPLRPSWEKGLGDEGSSPLPQRPEDLTVCDPACGSGHILVYAFDLLFEIYQEQGYLERDIPGLILTHNLFGLDLDERAVQLASFAVLMKARAKNSRILRHPPTLNLVTVRSTRHLANQLTTSQLTTTAPSAPEPLINHQLALGEVRSVQLPIVQQAHEPRLGKLLSGLLTAFEDADHLGSLITPPAFDATALYAELETMEQTAPVFVELFAALRHVVKQAELLRKQYWVVVANPPYMGGGSFNEKLKTFVSKQYPRGKGDLFAVFMERCLEQTCKDGLMAMINQHSWMFLSSYEDLRNLILSRYSIQSMLHLGYGVFQELNSKVVQSAAFVIHNQKPSSNQNGVYVRLIDFQGIGKLNEVKTLEAIANPNCGYLYHAKAIDFAKISGSPIAYWVSSKARQAFETGKSLGSIAAAKHGMFTSNDNAFLRYWHEVKKSKIGSREEAKGSSKKWFPYNKGGSFRKWFGNNEYIINWENDGHQIKKSADEKYPYLKGNLDFVLGGQKFFFKKGATWSSLTSSNLSVRLSEQGFLFADKGQSLFAKDDNLHSIVGFLNSEVASHLLKAISPTLDFHSGYISKLPILDKLLPQEIIFQLTEIARKDWDEFETSWDFQTHPLLRDRTIYQLSQAFDSWKTASDQAFQQLKQLEEQNNRYWIDAYGLQDELTPDVPDEQITIRRADLARDIKSLISYAVGCMMGRYSLDHSGLIHAGQPFDPSQHTTFPADSDAILPITDQAYFDDDIVSRFVEFIKTAYGDTHLRANLDFIAHALTLRDGESAQDRIRRYFLTEFISDHIQTYKKRPIYWLFTSGKNRAFGALVYLHRYTPNTVAQIRTDYVLELQRKLAGEIDRTQTRFDEATTSTAKKAIQRRLKTLRDQNAELALYQAKLQTVSDRRIHLDLDDGVAYNYTRFKGLIYEGSDLKMADLEKKAQWKLDLLKQSVPYSPEV